MRILLSCSGGFSSSLVVSKIKEAAKQQNITCKVWAVNAGDVEENINDADILLIAPQIQFMVEPFKELCKERGIPFHLISHEHYGRCDGESILKIATELIENKA